MRWEDGRQERGAFRALLDGGGRGLGVGVPGTGDDVQAIKADPFGKGNEHLAITFSAMGTPLRAIQWFSKPEKFGLTYDVVTGDFRQANYSSLRKGDVGLRRLVEQIQHQTVIPRHCDPVADRFVDRAILAGSLRPRADGYRRTWIPPANEPTDPVKELEADIQAVRAGRMAPQEFITQWGRSWKKVMADHKAFWKFCDDQGITLDIDPRRPMSGSPLPRDANPAPAPNPDDPLPTPEA